MSASIQNEILNKSLNLSDSAPVTFGLADDFETKYVAMLLYYAGPLNRFSLMSCMSYTMGLGLFNG